jgi:hypothetical protein
VGESTIAGIGAFVESEVRKVRGDYIAQILYEYEEGEGER